MTRIKFVHKKLFDHGAVCGDNFEKSFAEILTGARNIGRIQVPPDAVHADFEHRGIGVGLVAGLLGDLVPY